MERGPIETGRGATESCNAGAYGCVCKTAEPALERLCAEAGPVSHWWKSRNLAQLCKVLQDLAAIDRSKSFSVQ
jgi:hypothetical protein